MIFVIFLTILFFNNVDASSVGLIENTTWQGNLTLVRYSATIWGDIDGDGRLDLVLSGCLSDGGNDCENGVITEIYTNNGTTLDINYTWGGNLTGVGWSSIALGDIDNDGDLDLAATGCLSATSTCGGGTVAKIYINNGTVLEENTTWESNLTGTWDGHISFGDVNNDGKLDLAFVGKTSSDYIAKIYINNGTVLEENTTWENDLTGLEDGSLSWGDIDNDGDLDLVLTGDIGVSDKTTKVYINNGTVLLENSTWGNELEQLSESSPIFGDYDNDGDLDLIIMGCCDYLYAYKNNGTVLIEYQKRTADGGQEFIGIFAGSIGFGDYDNDGYLDFVGVGRESGYNRAYNYNSTSGIFVQDATASSDLEDDNMQKGSIAWGDIDNDGDLDLVITGGKIATGLLSKIYISNSTTSNTQPTAPVGADNFTSNYQDGVLILTWADGGDAETPANGLYYNLRIGSSSAGNDIVSGVYGGSSGGGNGGGPSSGYFGNMMQRQSIALKLSLDVNTTYYWSVQTIDTALNGSVWSVEQSVTTTEDEVAPVITINSPVDNNVTSNTTAWFNVTVIDNGGTLSNVSFYGNWGGWHRNVTNTSGINDTIYLFNATLSEGEYQWRVRACDYRDNCANTTVRSFTIDTTYPAISLTTPINSGSWTSSGMVTFTYQVTDAGIKNCSLIVDGTIDQTDTVITAGAEQTFDKAMSNSAYTWAVNCTDNVGYFNGSAVWALTVSYTPGNGGGGGGSSGGGGGSTTQATYSWASIPAGSTATATISKTGIDVTQVTMQIKEEVTAPKLAVKQLSDKPADVSIPTGTSYNYLELTPTNLEEANIQSAKIRFKVSKDWIETNDIDDDTVLLNRYKDGLWVKLSTAKVAKSVSVTGAVVALEDGCGFFCQLSNWFGSITGFATSGDYVYYEATTPGFSYFVITGEPKPRCNNNSICEVGEAGCIDCEAIEITCMPDQLNCYDGELWECDAEGNEWLLIEACWYGCANETTCAGMPEVRLDSWVWVIVIVIALIIGVAVGKNYKKLRLFQ